jgi:hypothetical protein
MPIAGSREPNPSPFVSSETKFHALPEVHFH